MSWVEQPFGDRCRANPGEAADLDAVGDEMIDLGELRTAAEDAGIPGQSFDLSVAEYRRESTPTRHESTTLRKGVSYAKVVGAGTLGVAGAVALVAQLPFPDAGIPAAILAGTASIGAVLADLRAALRGKSSDTDSAATQDAADRVRDPVDQLSAGLRHPDST